MIRIVHASDLHLTAREDRAYSVEVLREIVAVANEREADILVFAGDVFDRAEEVAPMQPVFVAECEAFKGAHIVYLPGNHESQNGQYGDLAALNWGSRITKCFDVPFCIKTLTVNGTAVEFLAVPHQLNYSGYRAWNIPRKATAHRIAVAHGVVMGVVAGGEDWEGESGVMDQSLFHDNQCSYVALGHIHKPSSIDSPAIKFHYPGSARVWRALESEPRGINIVEIGTRVDVSRHELTSPGLYRSYRILVDLGGDLDSVWPDESTWGRNDYVEIDVEGFVYNPSQLELLAGDRHKEAEKKVRRFVLNPRWAPCQELLRNALCRSFLIHLDTQRSILGEDLWREARKAGLGLILERLRA